MAEEFVIRIDTGRGTAGRGRQEPGTGMAGATALGAAAGLSSELWQAGDTFRYSERMTRENIRQNAQEGIYLTGSKLRKFGTMREMHWESQMHGDGTTQQQTLFGFGVERATGHLSKNSRLYKAGASGLATKAVHSHMQHRAYTSGDQYQNQRDSNNMRLAGYGVMLAMSGPKAPIVAAGIAVNEGVNAFNDSRQYNFDRALDTIQINNTQAVAGDISYGRRKGVR